MPKVKNIIYTTIAILFFAVNTYYYYVTLSMEGFPFWLSAPIGIMLIVFEAILYINKKRTLWAFLLVFSILMTQSGQFFDLMEYQKSNTSNEIKNDNNIDLIAINKRKLERAEKELNSITTEQTGWYYRREQAQKSYDEALTEYTKLLKTTTRSVTGETQEITMNRFKYYSFGNNIAERLLMFGFQLALSVFLALGGPICLSLRVKKKEKQTAKPRKDLQNIIRIAFHDYFQGNTKEVSRFDDVERSFKLHNIKINEQEYKKVLAKICKSGIIDNRLTVLIDVKNVKDVMEAMK